MSEREHLLDECAQIAAPAIAREMHEESERALSYDVFAEFFGRFVRAVPRLAARLAVPRPVAFFVDGDAEPYWVVDVRRRQVVRSVAPPDDVASIIQVPAGVLADAIDNNIVHYVHISMRYRTHLLADGASADLAMWSLLLVWELGYLPLRRLFRPRMIAVGWRRRAEILSAIRTVLFRRGSVVDRMSGQIASRDASETISR
jgi:hypothetical protein